MPNEKKYKQIRTIDVGRPGGHYIKIGVRKKGKGPRGGTTVLIGKLRNYKKR